MIDLDQHEKKALTALSVPSKGWHTRDRLEALGLWTADAEHIVANEPRVTLALIARIRELEALTGDLIEEIASGLARPKELDHERAVLEKGAVLP